MSATRSQISCARRLPLALKDGLTQPLLEADLAESRVVGRNQRALAEFGPEVPRMRVNDNLAGVVARAEALADQFIETELFGTGHFNVPFSGAPTAILPTALATSSAAMG